MKLDIPINYDIKKQQEVVVKANIPASKVREIVKMFFDKQDYDERRKWLKRNLDEVNLNTV
tara:strand:- start:176 stop:358 length:183 start_codon:yes stop_codon:yes gene_type:complete